MKRIFLVFFVILQSILLFAEDGEETSSDYFFPAVEVFGLNMLTWSFDRYVTQRDWAVISWDTISDNLTHGFVWDEDGFGTNQLSHPYSGALTFTAARSSGLDFWQSLPYPFAGSLMWELFMENEYPSINDIITTPMSGIVLGEISYRVSNLILGHGNASFARKSAASVISPMNGFNMLVDKSWEVPSYSPSYKVALSAGAGELMGGEEDALQTPVFMYMNYHMDYGDYSDLDSGYRPFDYFKTDAGVSLSSGSSIVSIFASGLLFGKYVYETDTGSCITGIFKNFNFLSNEVYKISASGVGAGLINTATSGSITLENLSILSVVVMGGIDSPYAGIADRDYNLGPGASMKVRSVITYKDFLKGYFMYKFYWLYPLSGSSGNEFSDILIAGITFLRPGAGGFSLEVTKHDRWSFYNDYPNLYVNNLAVRMYYSFYFGRT